MIACGAIFQLGTFFWKRGKLNMSNTSIESNQEQPEKSKKLDSPTLTQYTIRMGIINKSKIAKGQFWKTHCVRSANDQLTCERIVRPRCFVGN